MAWAEAKSRCVPQNRNSLGMLNAPSHAQTQPLPAILCNYVCTHRPPTACIYPLAMCVCMYIYTHVYKIPRDDGHGMRDASANMRGWTPGTEDKSRAGSREPPVMEPGREKELRQEGSEPPQYDQAPRPWIPHPGAAVGKQETGAMIRKGFFGAAPPSQQVPCDLCPSHPSICPSFSLSR